MANRKCPSRHRTCWAYAGDNFAVYWCYQCGAIRYPGDSTWTYPTGPGGENPAMVQYVKKLRREQLAPSGSLGY